MEVYRILTGLVINLPRGSLYITFGSHFFGASSLVVAIPARYRLFQHGAVLEWLWNLAIIVSITFSLILTAANKNFERYLIVEKERLRLAPLFDLELRTTPFDLTKVEPRIWIAYRSESMTELSTVDLSCTHRLIGLVTPDGPYSDVEALLSAISTVRLERDWIIEMETGIESHHTKEIPSKQLFCAIAQCLNRPPALSNLADAVSLCVVRTQAGFYFGESLAVDDATKPSAWKKRPFIFSAALSVEIADACLNILSNRLRRTNNLRPSQIPIFLDPACGSGTSLFVASSKGFIALGSDVNAVFVDGARRNLEHCGVDMSGVYLSVRDASEAKVTSPTTAPGWIDANIMLANLPWSENKLEYFGENDRIVARLGAELQQGCQCAFITRHGLPLTLLTDAGFERWAVVPVGQEQSGKKAFGGKCFITFAIKT